MKKAINFQAEEDLINKFKHLCLDRKKHMGPYICELMQKETEKEKVKEGEKEDGNISEE